MIRQLIRWGGHGNRGDVRSGPAPAARTSQRLDPAVAEAARRADVPDVDIYDRPATDRITPANLGLSIVVLVVALVLASFLLMWLL